MKPSKKKEKILIYQMAIFFLVIFVFFGVLLLQYKGNPFQFIVAKKEILKYAKEQYNNFEQRFSMGEVTYHHQDKSYNTIISYNENPKVTFIISFNKDKTITDTYDYDYIKGGSYLLRLEEELTTKWKKEVNDDNFFKQYRYFTIKFNETLDKMDTKTKEEILAGNMVELNKPLFYVDATITLDEMNVISFSQVFKDIYQKIKNTTLSPLSYQVMIYDKNNPKSGIEISNVTPKLMEDDTILEAITQSLVDEEKAKELYGIEIKLTEK